MNAYRIYVIKKPFFQAGFDIGEVESVGGWPQDDHIGVCFTKGRADGFDELHILLRIIARPEPPVVGFVPDFPHDRLARIASDESFGVTHKRLPPCLGGNATLFFIVVALIAKDGEDLQPALGRAIYESISFGKIISAFLFFHAVPEEILAHPFRSGARKGIQSGIMIKEMDINAE
ncbi:hypothetical protein OPIT5_18010 [Opitutaceae bacterium TAV5]|nr:hypothetical protein OPIT5_18010 [Opitutaceae bacterium TAV5]